MKLKHFFQKEGVYFVTSVTYLRRKIFLEPINARFLLATISYHRFILEFKLFGYVIMPEHFHIIIAPSEKYSLSKIMNFIKGNFARKYNQIYKKTDHVWQRRYYETVLKDKKELINRINYIHNNPVRQKLVIDVKDYEFSSYRQYFGETREKMQIPIDKFVL